MWKLKPTIIYHYIFKTKEDLPLKKNTKGKPNSKQVILVMITSKNDIKLITFCHLKKL